MKTRIIQNEPEQPAENSPTADAALNEPRRSTNVAARMGRWSARHRKTAIFGWLAFVVASFAVGVAVLPMQTIEPKDAAVGEAGEANRIIDAAFDLDKTGLGEFVVIQSKAKTVDDPAFRATIDDVVAALKGFDEVDELQSPIARGNDGQVSPDRRAALITFSPRGSYDEAALYIDAISDAVADVQAAHPDFYVGEAGVSTKKAVDKLVNSGIAQAGMIALPLTLAILLLVLGSAVAALVPLLVGVTSVIATLGLISLPSQLVPMDAQVSEVILLIGLAVGVDYSLFYLRREREERRAGRSESAALEAAAATSGRAVLISGFTVIIAMAGMLLSGDKTFMSFAIGTMLVVAVAMVGSLTVLPAVLSKLGDRVERLHVPLVGRLRRDNGEGRVWGAIVERVLRRPLVSAVVAAGLLLALAAPALQLRMATPGPDTFPKSLAVVKTYNRMQQAFPGKALPANVVVKAADINAPAVRRAIQRLEQKALATGHARAPITIETNKEHTIANITVPILGKGTDAQSNASLAALRDDVLPQTVGALPNVESGVTGLTAEWKDAKDQLRSKLPLVVGFVLLFAFALMLVAFRSIVVAIKAIVLNLLSVAAAYGVLVLVFQHGIGKELLGFSSTAGIDPVTPLLLFVILFGLSMDYHVFIVSRIRETFDRGASMDEAIAHGIKSTAGVVTSVAIVMVAVFSIFATLSMLFFKQFGVGLAAAILIDATLVRGVLLPATMK